MTDALQKLRAAIETVDDEIITLLVRRMRLAICIAAVKARIQAPILDASREAAVLARISARPHRPMRTEELRSIFQQLMAVSRAVQARTPHRTKETLT